MSNLSKLIEAVEGAEGPCVQLDREIGLAAGHLHFDADRGRLYYIAQDDGAHVYGGGGDHAIIRSYTDNSDAIFNLIDRKVPADWRLMLWRTERSGWAAHFMDVTDTSYAPTRALALCLALLRALQAQEASHD